MKSALLAYSTAVCACVLTTHWRRLVDFDEVSKHQLKLIYFVSSTLLKSSYIMEFEAKTIFLPYHQCTSRNMLVWRIFDWYTKITNTVSTTTVFGLCTCKWGIFAVVGDFSTLTQISYSMVFSKSQNAHMARTLSTLFQLEQNVWRKIHVMWIVGRDRGYEEILNDYGFF